MEMPYTFVKKNTGEFQLELVGKGRKSKYLDALDSNDVRQWNFTQPLYLGAHLMNDPDFKSNKKGITHNCVVHKLMEVYILKYIAKDDELFISYNK